MAVAAIARDPPLILGILRVRLPGSTTVVLVTFVVILLRVQGLLRGHRPFGTLEMRRWVRWF
jgi:hypothetical protein